MRRVRARDIRSELKSKNIASRPLENLGVTYGRPSKLSVQQNVLPKITLHPYLLTEINVEVNQDSADKTKKCPTFMVHLIHFEFR